MSFFTNYFNNGHWVMLIKGSMERVPPKTPCFQPVIIRRVNKGPVLCDSNVFSLKSHNPKSYILEHPFAKMHGPMRLLFLLVRLGEKREMQRFRSGEDSLTVPQGISVSSVNLSYVLEFPLDSGAAVESSVSYFPT